MHSTDIVCNSDMRRQTNLSQSNLKLFENFLEQTNLQNSCWSRSLSSPMLSNALVKVNKVVFQDVPEFVLCLLSGKGQIHQRTLWLKTTTHSFLLSISECSGCARIPQLTYYLTGGSAKICSDLKSDQVAKAICFGSILIDYFDLGFLTCKEMELN